MESHRHPGSLPIGARPGDHVSLRQTEVPLECPTKRRSGLQRSIASPSSAAGAGFRCRAHSAEKRRRLLALMILALHAEQFSRQKRGSIPVWSVRWPSAHSGAVGAAALEERFVSSFRPQLRARPPELRRSQLPQVVHLKVHESRSSAGSALKRGPSSAGTSRTATPNFQPRRLPARHFARKRTQTDPSNTIAAAARFCRNGGQQ